MPCPYGRLIVGKRTRDINSGCTGFERGDGSAVSLRGIDDRAMGLEEETAVPCPYGRAMGLEEETAVPCPYGRLIVGKRTRGINSGCTGFERGDGSAVSLPPFVGTRHCRLRISAPNCRLLYLNDITRRGCGFLADRANFTFIAIARNT